MPRRLKRSPSGVVASGAVTRDTLPTFAVLLVTIGAVLYNAVLALASASGLAVGAPHVMATEAAVLAVVTLMIGVTGLRRGDAPATLFLVFFVVSALVISFMSEGLFLPLVRGAAVIALFLMVGYRVQAGTLRRVFAVIALLVFAVLALEIAFPSLYVRLFEPGRYYEGTRGIEQLETVDGLFRNASGFEGRFTLARFLDHRAGSLFLEPVSLGNFAVVLTGFLLSFWGRLRRIEKISYCALILTILLSTNSRILLGFILLAPLIATAGGWMGRANRLLLMPAILAIAALLYTFGPAIEGDNLVGRIGLAIRSLADLDLAALAGGQSDLAASATDSGYAYVIYAGSILGLLALWVFVTTVLPDSSATQRKLGLFVALYVFLNLLISGNSVFSIKVAALLWLLVGCVAASGVREGQAAPRSWRGPAKGFRSPLPDGSLAG